MVPMSKFMDENYSGNFIDEIDDLIGLPPDINECGGGNMFGSGNSVVNIPTNDIPVSDSLFSGSHGNAEFDFLPELFVQYDDIVQPGWFSAFVEESFSSGGMCLGMDNTLISNPSSQNHFHASSPNSVLESNNSRARNKRPRTPTLCIRQTVQLNPHSFSSEDNPPKAKNFVELPSMEKLSKKTKVKTAFGRDPVKSHQEKCPVERKCKHCGITKTPQWRMGPMGPKTLCNACGVRHKSGRLFPEYRPAASPTFVPSLHSNSHKKVLEMRSKSELLVPTLSP